MTVHILHFSPKGTTLRAARSLAEGIGADIVETDLTARHPATPEFAEGDVAIFASPVYGGRIPVAAAQRMQAIAGTCQAIVVAVYGNRAFDDALVELQDIATQGGFAVIGAVGAVAEHALWGDLAKGRPDGKDARDLRQFGQLIAEKLASGNTSTPAIPGNRPYREFHSAPVGAACNAARCVRCGTCARGCPVGAIAMNDPSKTDASRCILCARCVSVCPVHARSLPAPLTEHVQKMLAPMLNVRKDNELFL